MLKSWFAVGLFSTVSMWAVTPPVPQQVLEAKTVYVVARVGQVLGGVGYMPDPQRARRQVEENLEKWGRYKLVDDPTKADLVLVIVEQHTGNAAVANKIDSGTVATAHAYEVAVLGDVLSVYPGGRLPDDNTQPFWTGIESSGWSWPANRVIHKFRKDVETAEKMAKKAAH